MFYELIVLRVYLSKQMAVDAILDMIERWLLILSSVASESASKGILTSLPKAGGGEFGKFYSLPALNDPRIVGFKLSGKLNNGVTATDLILTVTQMLRKHGVVGKFVEFYGEGVGKIS
ncbi:hypothetical protein CsSME_00012946 [Camellia sinensis var. sinensis]